MADEKQPGIQIDSDWKAQAQAEKQRLAAEAEKKRAQQQKQPSAAGGAAAGAAAGGQQQMPPASFETLVQTMTAQASLAMGMMPDPRTGQRFLNLDLAKHHIDMLGVIEDKTRGNLSDEETKLIGLTLHHLRQRFIDVVQAQRAQRRGEAEGGTA